MSESLVCDSSSKGGLWCRRDAGHDGFHCTAREGEGLGDAVWDLDGDKERTTGTAYKPTDLRVHDRLVHNHDIDPSCQERRRDDGDWIGKCMDTELKEAEARIKAYEIRQFETGAVRDTDTDKLDYEGFLSPQVIVAFAKYMHGHRKLNNGEYRDSDNWQKGMTLDSYMKSMLRHVMDLWLIHRGVETVRPENGAAVTLEDALGGILFNGMGYWHEKLQP